MASIDAEYYSNIYLYILYVNTYIDIQSNPGMLVMTNKIVIYYGIMTKLPAAGENFGKKWISKPIFLEDFMSPP